MRIMRIVIAVFLGILLAVGLACSGGNSEGPTPVPTSMPEQPRTLTPTPLPTVVMSCSEVLNSIKAPLVNYHDRYGEWPTVDGQPGDIEWSKLVPEFIEGIPSNDKQCDWWVNSHFWGTVCVQNRC